MRYLFRVGIGITTVAVAFVMPLQSHSFGGFGPNVVCTDFAQAPQNFARHRDGSITYRLSENFKARYPDAFSQYLVTDVARWWQDYISGFLWTDDISSQFSYYRNDPNRAVYELKSVLSHEFGHAMGMQHSDACFYNINPNTGEPRERNFRTAPGGPVAQPTLGPEVMNEVPTASSPGQKAEGEIDGYFRTPGRDAFEFMNVAYPFQSLSLDEIQAGSADILIDSTDADPSGGQTSFPGGFSNIEPGDSAQGFFFDGVNIWVGNNIELASRSESWQIENFTGFDIIQITVRTRGTNTRRAVSESAPAFFTNFGAGLTSSPETIVYSWTTPPGGPWPSTATGWLTLELDVHDWEVEESLIWANSNQAFPMGLASFEVQVPWGLVSPNAPVVGMAAGYAIAIDAPSEPTPVPDNIELIPPKTDVTPSGNRTLTATLPATDDTEIESYELLPIDRALSELIVRLPGPQRSEMLMRLFREQRRKVLDLDVQTKDNKPYNNGFAPVVRKGIQNGLISRRVEISLPDDQTYAVRLVATNKNGRVTSLAMPEHTTYHGTRLARCDAALDASSCCPHEIAGPVRIDIPQHYSPLNKWKEEGLNRPTCILGTDDLDLVDLSGSGPHFLATGGGDDKVFASVPGSMVLLGKGDDAFSAAGRAASNVYGGDGNDHIKTSLDMDQIKSGGGDDVVTALGGPDIIFAGPGNDFIDAGSGRDRVYPGPGRDYVAMGPGDDVVVYLHACELQDGAVLLGQGGDDVLVLPGTIAAARQAGVKYYGFELIVENAARASHFADCE